jgi:hypothetical protein
MEKWMAMVLSIGKLAINMKDIIKIIIEMEKEFYFFLMEIFLMEISKMTLCTDKVSIIGKRTVLTLKDMKVNSIKELLLEKESFIFLMEISMKDNFKKANFMALELSLKKMLNPKLDFG